MKKYRLGLLLGFVAGVSDASVMILNEGFVWQETLMALTFWTVIGYFIATIGKPAPGMQRGVLVSLSIVIPMVAVMNAMEAQDQSMLICVFAMTLGLGTILGHLLNILGE